MSDANLVNISVYDIDTWMASGYTTIAVFRSASGTGTFVEQTTSATRIALASATEYYTFTQTASGIAGYAYKFKYATASGVMSAFVTDWYLAWSSDLTEMLRYEIEDINDTISLRRYTIKELRRFVMMALSQLQSSGYLRKFYSNKDGIIFPRSNNNQDRAIMLQQAVIQVNKSQLNKAADTNVLFSDGRGRFNNRSWTAIKENFKMLIEERDASIRRANREPLTPQIADMKVGGVST